MEKNKILYDFIYMWNVKNQKKWMNKTEIDSQMQRTNRWLAERWGEGDE